MNSSEFPYYKVINDNSLEQGDIVPQCPVVEVVEGEGVEDAELIADDLSPQADVFRGNMVIMTQTCDGSDPLIVDKCLFGHEFF